MKQKILVVGSLNMDMVIDMVQMPAVGETVLGSSLTYNPGGKGANQACAAARLGGNVKMLGCVGNDEFGELLKKNLSRCGVDVSDIKTGSKNTGLACIYVDSQGNNSIVVIPGANLECDVEYLKACDKAFQECDYLILQMEIPKEAIYYAINRAKELSKTVILNPAPAPDEFPEDIFQKLDYITPNGTELLKLGGGSGNTIEKYTQVARKLVDKGVKNVLVTMGEKGALLVSEKGAEIFPARKVTPIDTTAAGDCFNGAFLVALSEGMDHNKAVMFANAASSIAVTRNGAQASIPDRNETDEVLEDWIYKISKTSFE
nr:ribokinase [Herbinix hemicellulosilytica]